MKNKFFFFKKKKGRIHGNGREKALPPYLYILLRAAGCCRAVPQESPWWPAGLRTPSLLPTMMSAPPPPSRFNTTRQTPEKLYNIIFHIRSYRRNYFSYRISWKFVRHCHVRRFKKKKIMNICFIVSFVKRTYKRIVVLIIYQILSQAN